MIKKNITDEIILREKIIKFALKQYSKKYVHGCHGPNSFDCAGLIWYIYNTIIKIDLYYQGIGLSTTTKIMTSKYGKITLYEENQIKKNLEVLNKGDIVFFHRQSMNDSEPKENNKYPGHCGIYLDNNYFIHCSKPKGKVIISNFNNNIYWKKTLVASKNIISDVKILSKTKGEL